MKRFDEVVFEQKRFGFRTGNGRFKTCNLCHHQRDAGRKPRAPEVGRNAVFEVARLADIEARAVLRKIAVAPREMRKRADFGCGVEGGFRGGGGIAFVCGLLRKRQIFGRHQQLSKNGSALLLFVFVLKIEVELDRLIFAVDLFGCGAAELEPGLGRRAVGAGSGA